MPQRVRKIGTAPVGQPGGHYALYRLMRMGYLAALALPNAPVADMLASG